MFSPQFLTDSYCHHLCQSWGAEWGLRAPGVWIPPPGPSLQRQVHSIGDKAQLVVRCPGFEHIKIGQTGVFQEHSFLTQVMMSHHWLYLDIIWDSSFWNVWRNILRRNRKGLTGAWWSQGFLCKLQHLKFSFIKDIAHRSDTKKTLWLLFFPLASKGICPYFGTVPLQYGHSPVQIIALRPVCYTSAAFFTPLLASSSSLYTRRSWF